MTPTKFDEFCALMLKIRTEMGRRKRREAQEDKEEEAGEKGRRTDTGSTTGCTRGVGRGDAKTDPDVCRGTDGNGNGDGNGVLVPDGFAHVFDAAPLSLDTAAAAAAAGTAAGTAAVGTLAGAPRTPVDASLISGGKTDLESGGAARISRDGDGEGERTIEGAVMECPPCTPPQTQAQTQAHTQAHTQAQAPPPSHSKMTSTRPVTAGEGEAEAFLASEFADMHLINKVTF